MMMVIKRMGMLMLSVRMELVKDIMILKPFGKYVHLPISISMRSQSSWVFTNDNLKKRLTCMDQAWHQCFGDRSWAFLCPNGTIFNQVHPYEDDRSWCWGWWSKWEENAEPNYGILLWLILIRLKLWREQYDDDHHYHFADHDPMMMPRSCLPVSGGSTLTASPRKAFMLSMRLSSAPLGKTSLTKK